MPRTTKISSLEAKLAPSGINYRNLSPTKTEIIKLTPTEIQELIDKNRQFANRIMSRFQSNSEFTEKHGSGTLRKGDKIGIQTGPHRTHERIAYEFGYEFTSAHSTRINLGPVISEGDCKQITELGWHAERYMEHAFPGDEIAVKYIVCDPSEREPRVEGPGIIITRTTAPFIPDGHLVFAIVAPVVNHQYLPALNPF